MNRTIRDDFGAIMRNVSPTEPFPSPSLTPPHSSDQPTITTSIPNNDNKASSSLVLLFGFTSLSFLSLVLLIRSSHSKPKTNQVKNKATVAKIEEEEEEEASVPTRRRSRKEEEEFEVFVAVDKFKFTASHFIAFCGYRERLHGHNYSVGLRLLGSHKVGSDGYVVDFGEIKTVVTSVCKSLNEHFLLPMLSDCLEIENDEQEWRVKCEDGATFHFPFKDVVALPIAHSSAEELAKHVWGCIVEGFSFDRLVQRGVCEMEVTVAEAPNQQASYRRRLM